MSMPHATEKVQWEGDLVFKIGGKMFAVVDLDAGDEFCFKCTPDGFAELTEREGIIPAPYAARYHWVMVKGWRTLREPEIRDLVRNSYQLVLEKLPKKLQKSMR
jgi:predicted DNA-binding protein (MmcQ/YjbR family)